MRKPIIGVVPTLSLNTGPSIFGDTFQYVHSYTQRIVETGGLPIGLIMPNGDLDLETLSMCDGIVIPGGSKIWHYIYHIMYYAIKNDIPLLGICLGSQAMSIYSEMKEKIDNNEIKSTKDISLIYDEIKEKNDGMVLKRLPAGHMHSKKGVHRDHLEDSYHSIEIKPESLLYDIYQTKQMNVPSYHGFDYEFIGPEFEVSSYAPDGVSESIEYLDPDRFMLGLHFHGELLEDKDGKPNKVFSRLVYESAKRKR